MKLIQDIIYGTEAPESQKLDLYLPEGEAADLFIFFHGGGLEHGSKENCSRQHSRPSTILRAAEFWVRS